MSRASGLTIAAVLCRRELIRFIRQPKRIAGAIAAPIMLWLFMASGFSRAIELESLDDMSYSSFLLPGAMTLIAVFAAIFASISIIEDRHDGWLQSVLVSPSPRWSIALGKIVGGAIVAWTQAAVLLLALPMLAVDVSVVGVGLALIALGVTSFAMTALGLAFAWRSETTSDFHSVMTLIFLPMWMLSGAMFPEAGASRWMYYVMHANPLTWCTESIRNPLLGGTVLLPFIVALGFAGVMMTIATVIISRPGKGS